MEHRVWQTLSRWETVLSLVTGVGTIWAARELFTQGLQASVPAWVLVLTAVSAGCLGWFIGRQQAAGRRAFGAEGPEPPKHSKNIDEINFKYLPDPPTKHGWTLGIENQAKLAPEFSAAPDAPVPGSLSINSKGNYYLDYSVSPCAGVSNEVVLHVRFLTNAAFYVYVKIASRDGTQRRCVWLSESISTVRPEKFTDAEWVVPADGEVLEHGWVRLRISVPDQVQCSFGREGWVYQQLIGFRLRGCIGVSPVTLERTVDS